MSVSDFLIEDGRLKKYSGAEADVTIPEGVTEICNGVFRKHEEIISVNFPEGLKKIGTFAFIKCCNLERVTLPSTIVEICDAAFAECNKMCDFRMPHGVPELQFYNMFKDIKKKKNVAFNVRLYLFGEKTCNSEFDKECRERIVKDPERYFGQVLAHNSVSALRKLLDAADTLDSEMLLRFIDMSAEEKAVGITAFLLEYKNKYFNE